MSMSEKEIIEAVKQIDAMLDEAILVSEELRSAWGSIKWKSADKDNMEFTATITCSHKEKIDELLGKLLGETTT